MRTTIYTIKQSLPSIRFIKILVLLGTFFTAMLLSVQMADAAVKTWDNTSGDGLWSTCSNWDTDTCPGASDIATFDGTSDTPSSIDGTNLSVAGIDINVGYTTSTITNNLSGTLTVGTSDFAIADGTFIGGTGSNIDINDDIFIDGGIFNASTGTMTVGGTWTNSGGTFIHNNGTVKSTVAAYDVWDFNGSETFYNFTADCYGGTNCPSGNRGPYLASGDNLIIEGTLTLTDGTINYTSVDGGITAKGNVTVGPSWDSGGTTRSALTFGGTSQQIFDLTGGTDKANMDIIVNKTGGGVVLASGLIMDQSGQDLTIQEGTFNTNGQNLTVSGGAFTVEAGGTFAWNGDETITANVGFPTFASGSTVSYNAMSGSRAIQNWDYHHLKINGSGGTFTLGAAESITGDLTVLAGTFDANDQTMTIAGNTTISGGIVKTGTNTFTFGDEVGDSVSLSNAELQIESDDTVADIVINAGTWTNGISGKVTYNVATVESTKLLSALSPYNHLTINSAGTTYTLDGAIDVNYDFTLSAGTLDVDSVNNYQINVGAKWSNSGTFNARDGTVIFDDADTTSIISGDTTFNNFTSTTGGKAFIFETPYTQTINGTWTLTGGPNSLITLRSSSSNTAWNVSVAAVSGFDYLDVQDSAASGAAVPIPPGANSIDRGGNTGWGFNTAPAVSIASGVLQSDGSGDVEITFTVDDVDNDDTVRARIEYSIDGGFSWLDPTLTTTDSETTSTYGDPKINNDVVYQVGTASGYITTSSGANTVVTIWEAATDLVESTDISNARIRVTPYDGTDVGDVTTGADFVLDLAIPSGLGALLRSNLSISSLTLTWNAATDTNFNHYEIWYGGNQLDVQGRTGTATEWDDSDDLDLATASTTSTLVTADPRNIYFKIWAVDDYGNSATIGDIFTTISHSGDASSTVSNSTVTPDTTLVAPPTPPTPDEPTEVTPPVPPTSDEPTEVTPPVPPTSDEPTEVTPPVPPIPPEPDDKDKRDKSTLEEIGIKEPPEHWADGYLKDLNQDQRLLQEAETAQGFFDLLSDMFTHPNNLILRGRAVRFLSVMKGQDLSGFIVNSVGFMDVDNQHQNVKSIFFALQEKLIDGYPDGTFKPDQVLIRVEATKMIVNFFGKKIDPTLKGDALLKAYGLQKSPFKDINLNEWYAPYVIYAKINKVVEGFQDGTFRPDKGTTYAEFIKMVTIMKDREDTNEDAHNDTETITEDTMATEITADTDEDTVIAAPPPVTTYEYLEPDIYYYGTPTEEEPVVISEPTIAISETPEALEDFVKNIRPNENQDPKKDTDGDGISDYQEILNGADPESADSDGDGISDSDEIAAESDPGNWDSDGDGIADHAEAAGQVNIYNAPDLSETVKEAYAEEHSIKTPLGTTDSDGDGLSDEEELAINTDPQNADSDGDGLSDGEEINNYGTNPNEATKASELDNLRITNMRTNENLAQGPQVVSGRGSSNSWVRLYAIDQEGERIEIGKTQIDETGKYHMLSDPLDPGRYTLILTSDDGLSQPATLNVVEESRVPKAETAEDSLEDGARTEDPILKIIPPVNHKIVVTWQSVVLSQTLIADASGRTVEIRPSATLDKGDHTVTYYTVDRETNEKSEPEQISFKVTGTQTAFLSGDTEERSPWLIIFGSIIILGLLTGFAIFFKKRKTENA